MPKGAAGGHIARPVSYYKFLRAKTYSLKMASRYCEHLRDVVMAMYGISHTIHTKVGDEFIRGVSGGERKRVTIAEATLSNAPFQCWDK